LRSTILLLALTAFAFSSSQARTVADTTNGFKYIVKAVKIDRDIDLTGKLTDPLWKTAPRVQLNYEIQPGNNTPAPQKTTAMVLYNSRYLYLGFKCYDTAPSSIRAHITDRDNAFNDDFVGAIIDPYHDHQRAYEVFENPFGVQMDGMRNGNNEDMSFDMIWYSKASLNDSGYTAEMAIPFSSMRFPTKEVQNWGLEIFRNLPRTSRVQISWVHLNLNDPCLMCQMGTLEGLKGLQSTGSVELLPYAMGLESGSINDNNVPNSGFSNGPVTGRIGMGVKYTPNPSLSLEGVANPDFSQVESDAAQISVNNTFALFYPEKRPFFMDGNDIFTTLIQTYYSRTINNPLGAAKIVEKSGPLSIAYLGAEDRNSPFIVAGEEGSVADNNGDNTFSTPYSSFSNILRARYNFGLQSFVGGIATTRNFTNAHNYVGGVDWSLFFGGSYTFDGQFLVSNTKELNDTNLVSDPSYFGNTRFTKAFDGQEYDGTGFETDFRRDAREYSFKLTYSDFSPTFQAEDGYVFSNDLRTLIMDHSMEFYPNSKLFDNWGFDVNSGLQFDYQGGRKQRWIIPDIFLNLKAQTQLYVNYLFVNDELFHSVNFVRVNRWQFGVYANPASMISINLDAAVGRFIYRADQPALGRGHNITAEVTLKPTDRLSLTIDYSRSRLSNVVGGELLFDGYISRLEGIYQFTNRIFVRLIGQYDQFQKQIEIDPLFSYKLNPFTIFYAGSTHSFDKYGSPYGIVQTGRQFFIKLQYLLRD
jgi:Domain of unknown function (DUF5916)/Carbohydrate family 9 binding domain-like